MFTGVKILSSGIRNNQKIRTIPAWNKGPSSDDIFTHLKALTVESNQTDTVSTFGSATGYIGGVLAPNGSIYSEPFNATTVLKILSPQAINPNLALSRLFNKY